MATLKFAKKATAEAKAKTQEVELSGDESRKDQAGKLIDEIAELGPEIDRAKEFLKGVSVKVKERDSLLEEIAEEHGLGDDDKMLVKGQTHQAEIGKRGNSRHIIDMQAVAKEMGDELFMQCATVRLKDVDDYLTKPQADKLLEYGRTGRGISITKIS